MRGSQSSATQIDNRRKTSKRAVILPQAMWEVQAIREEDQEKVSEKIAKTHRSNCLVHRRTIGFFVSWTSEDERLRPPVASRLQYDPLGGPDARLAPPSPYHAGLTPPPL
jgi:hypothetical protein